MWAFNAFKQIWPLESKQQQNRKGEETFFLLSFSMRKMKHFLWSWLTVRSIYVPQFFFCPKEICSLAFWNCYRGQTFGLFKSSMFQVLQRQELGIRLQCDTCTDLPENIFQHENVLCVKLYSNWEKIWLLVNLVFHWARLSLAQ